MKSRYCAKTHIVHCSLPELDVNGCMCLIDKVFTIIINISLFDFI